MSLGGCNSLQQRFDTASSLANNNGFSKQIFSESPFTIVSYHKIGSQTDSATLFIEGDGLAWLSKRRISPNPTPLNPVGLKLAINDNSPNVFYLARPCQYLNLNSEKNCNHSYWTSKRASKEIIESINHTITIIKKQFNIDKFRLVGYSGGGTIATLLASIRNDIEDLRTVAGNLDINAFVQQHKITPLYGSINPVDYAEKLSTIPQQHYVSRNDEIITRSITESYLNHLKNHDTKLHCVHVTETDVHSHSEGWERYWSKQQHTPVSCLK
ncbi:MAG: alpha/beta hydrolase [Proteobacteria bacterium]|nr:alpha/beta hydrolase [Pseudomonadota bacterium]NOG59690.1 alpha/beta hydrolase [Pseudomonadota bacterium]